MPLPPTVSCFIKIQIAFTFLVLTHPGKIGKGFPYSLLSVGPWTDPGVQAVSPQVTVSHPLGGRLPLLSIWPAVTSPATEHHLPLAGTKLYCLVTGAHRCEQLAQGCYAALPRIGFEPATYWSQDQCSAHCTTAGNPGQMAVKQFVVVVVIIIVITTSNNHSNVCGAVVMAWPLWGFSLLFWMQTRRQLATNHRTYSTDLDCESACWLLLSTSFMANYCYHWVLKLIFILPSHKGWKAEST